MSGVEDLLLYPLATGDQPVCPKCCSPLVLKASVGCLIFPGLNAQTVDARKPLPTTTTGHLRIATKQARRF